MTEGPDPTSAALGPLVRRIRRAADCSQRELARRLGLSATAVAQAETGARDLPATVLIRAAGLAGLRLGLLDASGREAPGMTPDAVRDRSGRHFPAHLDPRHGDVWWWHGPERYTRERPEYTFDRDRAERDRFRAVDGVPPDHHVARPGDSLAERAWARRAADNAARTARAQDAARERQRLGIVDDLDLTCTCPPGCEELLFPDRPLSPAQNAVPHVEDCPCRCDIA